jgi:DnaJ-class molecular chaperone
MKKGEKSERCPTCGGTNETTTNTGRVKVHAKHVSVKAPDPQGDGQKVGASDDKTADNFVEFMGKTPKPRP